MFELMLRRNTDNRGRGYNDRWTMRQCIKIMCLPLRGKGWRWWEVKRSGIEDDFSMGESETKHCGDVWVAFGVHCLQLPG